MRCLAPLAACSRQMETGSCVTLGVGVAVEVGVTEGVGGVVAVGVAEGVGVAVGNEGFLAVGTGVGVSGSEVGSDVS